MVLPILGEIGEIEALFLAIFLVSIFFGAVARKTDFCPLGGIADVVHSGNTGRLSMYFFAIAIAILGVTVSEALEVFSADGTRPPYRMSQFRWPAYLVGGAFFGIGMTLCRGCGMKNILNLGGGNLKAIVAILGMGAFNYKSLFYFLRDKRFDAGVDVYNDLDECVDAIMKCQAEFSLAKTTKGLKVDTKK